jgi:anti-sigma factor (TIGR02949 family)
MSEEINCEETKRQVHEYLHNELSEQEISDITAHVANCESCESDYNFEHAFNRVIKQSCDEAPPDELAQRIIDRIRLIDSGRAEH